MKRLFGVMAVGLLAAGCRAFEGQSVAATMQAQNITFVAEATQIFETAQARGTTVFMTAEAADTAIAMNQNVNLQLMATARAIIAPTQPRVGSGDLGVEAAITTGETQFVDFALASAVRDSDGCASGIRSNFTMQDNHIYITARALNIKARTQMRVEWRKEGVIAWYDNFIVHDDHAELCIWFDIATSFVNFSPGAWSVIIYAGPTAVSPVVNFSITG